MNLGLKASAISGPYSESRKSFTAAVVVVFCDVSTHWNSNRVSARSISSGIACSVFTYIPIVLDMIMITAKQSTL